MIQNPSYRPFTCASIGYVATTNIMTTITDTQILVQLSPDYVGVELGIGESLLIKAIAESTGRSLAVIKSDLKKEGDLGLVAMVRIRLFNECRNRTNHCAELQKQAENALQTQTP